METCTSLASLLEPILGLGLALNLAYLNLPWFSFITVISKGVETHLSGLSPHIKKSVEETPWYKDAVAISKIHTLEVFDLSETYPKWISFKSWGNSFFFNVLFYWRIGKGLSIISVGFCAIYIILGVASQMALANDPTNPVMCFLISIAGAPFIPSIVTLCWPILCVGGGALVRHTVMRDLRYNLKNLGIQAVKDAAETIDTVGKEVEAAIPAAPATELTAH